MASTEAQKRAVKKAQSKCDAIMLRPPKGEGAAIRAAAAATGQSNQQYILQATRERMERDGADGPQEVAEQPAGAKVVLLSSEAMEAAQRAAEVTGEAVGEFLARAVETQAQRDRSSMAMGINPTTGDKMKGEA